MLKIYDYKIVLIFLFIGCVTFIIGFESDLPASVNKLDFQLQEERKDGLSRFIHIFSNNVKVGVLIILMGAISGGLGSVLIFSLNGYSFGLLVDSLFTYYRNPIDIMLIHVLPHAPTEILAFCLCGCIGFKGFYFAKQIVLRNHISLAHLPKIKEMYLPGVLFFVSAFVESFISFGVLF